MVELFRLRQCGRGEVPLYACNRYVHSLCFVFFLLLCGTVEIMKWQRADGSLPFHKLVFLPSQTFSDSLYSLVCLSSWLGRLLCHSSRLAAVKFCMSAWLVMRRSLHGKQWLPRDIDVCCTVVSLSVLLRKRYEKCLDICIDSISKIETCNGAHTAGHE